LGAVFSVFLYVFVLQFADPRTSIYCFYSVCLLYFATRDNNISNYSVSCFQVLFLMYHYFAATEIYNAIRVFIAAYVWMTGFGNFSYYYIKKDFSLARFAQVSILISGPICSVLGCIFISYIWYGTFTYDTDERHYTIPCR
jgi:hypothetical protein